MLNENTAFSQEMLLEIIMKSVDKNTGYFDLLLQSAEYLEERIGRISGDVQDIKSSTTQINYKLDKMLEKINALENAFQDLKDETREVDQKIILMSSKLDRIEKEIYQELCS